MVQVYLFSRKQQTFVYVRQWSAVKLRELFEYPMWSAAKLYFLLYVNADLPGCLTNFIPNMYANDTIITNSKAAINAIDRLYQ